MVIEHVLYLDEPITLEYQKNDRTGKHAFLLPGCPLRICTGVDSVRRPVYRETCKFVLPIEHSTGKAGDHYVKGWDTSDQQRVKNASEIHTQNERSEKKPSDYLNSMDLEVDY